MANQDAENAGRPKGNSKEEYDNAKRLYLENLWRRVNGQRFDGVTKHHTHLLSNCNDILPDELCDVVKVPHGSTISFSIREGTHFVVVVENGKRRYIKKK